MRGALNIPGELSQVSASLEAGLASVESIFDGQLRSDLPPVAGLVRHVEHYRGKMLRPTLAILCGLASDRSRSGAWNELATVGAVCEMVHMATLVHDDVLDEAETRRRGATVNRLHGNEAAVILGDYLIASAFHLCSTLPDPEYAREVGKASAVMCAGELLQLHHRNDLSLDEATYFEILERKTGALVAVSCKLGAFAAGATPELCARFESFGLKLGVAFQIQDDLLDLAGDESVVGKSVRKDLEKGKLTLPLIHHLGVASPIQRGRTLAALDRFVTQGSGAGGRADELGASLAGALESTGSVTHARAVASGLVEEALAQLDGIDTSPARQVLELMAQAVVARAF
jgi:octaprenyl-diphosphate synthase